MALTINGKTMEQVFHSLPNTLQRQVIFLDGYDGCWISTRKFKIGKKPAVKYKYKYYTLIRLIYYLVYHKRVLKRRGRHVHVFQKCRNDLCFNPAHLYLVKNRYVNYEKEPLTDDDISFLLGMQVNKNIKT